MYKVNLAFFDDMVKIEVKDEQGEMVLRAVTMTAPLVGFCSLGTEYAVEATAPALPQAIALRVNGDDILLANPTDPEKPIHLKKADLIAAVMKGQLHGKEKQVVERSDTYFGPAEGRDLRIGGGVQPERHRDTFEEHARTEGADGQSGPSEAAPL